MAQLVLEHVVKRFGEVLAVDDFTFTIEDHEFLVLLGPSGCGKTTTLRMVAGLEEPSAGRIVIGGRDVTALEPKDRDIAMVFQNYALYPHMTVYDNMAFGLRLRRRPSAEIHRRVGEAAESLGLTALLGRRPRELSGGQRQRVALGRAIVREPQAFLMDEPLSNLDAQLRAQTRVELKNLHQRLAATVVYVTHDQVEAMTMGTHIVVMKDGVIQQADTPEGLYTNPRNQFVATFVGTPPMNVVSGTLERQAGHLVLRLGPHTTLAVPASQRPVVESLGSPNVVMGIRAEHVHVDGEPGNQQLELDCRLGVVESMGHESLVYLDAEGQQLVARADASFRGTMGENITARLAVSGLRWFNPDTGQNAAIA